MSKEYSKLKECKINRYRLVDGDMKFNISVDAGSSETRTHTWVDKPRSGEVLEVPAGYSVVTENIESIRSQSDSLYDNLEIHIVDSTPNKAEKLFDDITIIKCGLLEDMRLPVAKTSSNTGKALQDTTYINTLANIAINAYVNYYENGVCGNTIKPKITLALPQEDITSAKRQEDIIEKLAGTYMVNLVRADFCVKIKIVKDNIMLFDEAQAALGFWRIENKVGPDQTKGVLIIDAGGRSTDLSIMINGRVIAKGSYTGKFGGQKFIDLIVDKYTNETGADMPTRDMVYDALDTGLMQDGNSYVDITKYIDDAKREIVSTIETDISSLLDANDLRMKQFNIVLCTGRLMGKTENEENKVPSMAVYIEKFVKAASQNTAVGLIEEPHALVKGLSLARAAFDARKKK